MGRAAQKKQQAQDLTDLIFNPMKNEQSNCCGADMIPPDWEEAESAGSLWQAYAVYICKACHKACEPKHYIKTDIDELYDPKHYDKET